MKTVKAVAFALVAGLAMSAAAAPKYRATLTASGYSGASTLTNFPVLVRISGAKISGFSYDVCAANGADLSFKGVDGTTLAHEIDTWNPEGESLVWVKVPLLATNTTFKIRWGDSDVTASTSTNATWNVNYVGVWHMGEADGVCSNSSPCGAKYDAEPKGTPANSVRYADTDAPIGYARTTGSGTAYLSIPSYDAENVGSNFTMSGWVRLDKASGWPRLFSRKENNSDAGGWAMEMEVSYTTFALLGGENKYFVGSLPTLSNSWVHVTIVYNGTTGTVYGNGESVSSNTINPAADNGKPLSIGASSSGGDRACGQFDECRLMKGAASADWVKADYDTVKKPDFLTYGVARPLGFMLFVR